MKKFLLFFSIAFLITALLTPSMGYAQSVGINADGSAPDASAMLDVKNPNKGVLIPRVALTTTDVAAPVTAPIESLLIYNTATAGTGATAVTPGFYYWTGSLWAKIVGVTGIAGPQGSVAANYNDFYALIPSDNSTTVAPGSGVEFPRSNIGFSNIGSVTASTFILRAIGDYEITFNVPVTEAGQLVVQLNGVEQPQTVVGRATGTSQIVGNYIITTTSVDTILSIVNPMNATTALTITPLAGGQSPVSAHLIIKKLD